MGPLAVAFVGSTLGTGASSKVTFLVGVATLGTKLQWFGKGSNPGGADGEAGAGAGFGAVSVASGKISASCCEAACLLLLIGASGDAGDG